MKHKILKKGQQVKVGIGSNASDFNKGKLNILSIYIFPDWKDMIFEIEGTVKLITFKHSPKIFGAYLLKYKGKDVGYIYNTGVTPIEVCKTYGNIKKV